MVLTLQAAFQHKAMDYGLYYFLCSLISGNFVGVLHEMQEKKLQTKMEVDMMLNEKLKTIDDAITKKKMIMDGHPVVPLTPAEKMVAYDCAFTLCTRKRDYSSMVYEKYTNCLSERIQERVLPGLMAKNGTELLTEITRLWSEYGEFASFLSKIFAYLDRFYIPRRGLLSLADSMRYYFRNLVCDKLFSKLQEAMMRLIIHEREGGQIDRNLLKTAFYFFLEVEEKGTTHYYEKIEQIMLAEVAAYYTQLSLEWWFWRDTFSNYLRKVDWCLNQEESRAEIYPLQTTKTKLLEVMKYVLLERNAKKWGQKQNTEGLAAGDQYRRSDVCAFGVCKGIRNPQLVGFRVPGEAQKIDQIMEKFSKRYCKCNPKVFSSADTAYALAYSVIMRQTKMEVDMMLNEKLKTIDDAITKKKMIMDGHPVVPLTPAEKMVAYDCVYTLLMRKQSDYCSLVYEKYTNCLSERIQERVLPGLMAKNGTELLTEVTRLWSEYREFASFLLKIFECLDRFYIRRRGLLSLADTMRYYFRNLVCDKLFSKLQEAMMRLIIHEREGGQIDRNLLKTAFYFFLEVEEKGTTHYYEKIEQIMLAEVAAYYTQLSLEWWFWRDTFSNYLRKVDWCLNQEESRAEIYPLQTTKTKLLEVMKYVLLERNAKKWGQKQNTEGLAAGDQDSSAVLAASIAEVMSALLGFAKE
ncbi:unnamed protein product [Dovyalis caffra]|uniref:SEC7 domain-containing protein n=1 Tax=Dovyalis caffra TaxID=77055 RepID=A0AAV1RYU8_9ROSI|nr:unnamed protein product [Dovyalis caffra]